MFVSPYGDDRWSGQFAEPLSSRSDGPFATVERAREEVQRLRAPSGGPRAPVTVFLRGGTYTLPETFRLGPRDGGTAEAPVVYAAYRGEQVRLSGGRVVTGWSRHRDAVLKADVRAWGLDALGPLHPRIAGAGPAFELFFAEEPQDLARWPNRDPADPHGGGWAYVAAAGEGERARFGYAGERPRSWSRPQEAQVNLWTQNWFDQYLGVAAIDPSAHEIALAQPAAYAIQPGQRFFLSNVAEELDAPGEWYFDAADGTLYFWPPAPIGSAEACVSLLDTLIALDGAEHVTFRGLTLECCRGTALTIDGGRGNRVAACAVRNAAGAGIAIRGGEANIAFGNDIHGVGHGGILLSGGDRPSLRPAGHAAVNNHIHHYGRLVKCYSAAVHVDGVGNRVAHNLIHDGPHNAILLGGNDHVLEFNHIHHVCTQSSDVGAFYMGRDYSAQGNTLRHNVFHDIHGFGLAGDAGPGAWRYESPCSAWAVYIDDAASGVTVYGNLFYRVPMGAVMIGGGRNIAVENNVFVDCFPAVHIDARWDGFELWHTQMRESLEALPYRRPPWSERYPHLLRYYDLDPRRPADNRVTQNVIAYGRDDFMGFWRAVEAPGAARVYDLPDFDADSTVFARNTIWHGGLPVRVHARAYGAGRPAETLPWEGWQARGFDQDSALADPLFAGPAADDYGLRPESPAFRAGFTEVPLERAGLFPDWERASWPVPVDSRRGTVALVRTVVRAERDECGPARP